MKHPSFLYATGTIPIFTLEADAQEHAAELQQLCSACELDLYPVGPQPVSDRHFSDFRKKSPISVQFHDDAWYHGMVVEINSEGHLTVNFKDGTQDLVEPEHPWKYGHC